jgi:hypothetical protein
MRVEAMVELTSSSFRIAALYSVLLIMQIFS